MGATGEIYHECRHNDFDASRASDFMRSNIEREIKPNKMIAGHLVPGLQTNKYTIPHELYILCEKPSGIRFAIVVTITIEHSEIIWRNESEFEGPVYSKCPKFIINQLSPTKQEYSIAWRNRCKENY
tara:strand:+ start:5972 stop:6352 length:381 start_codon:yes stop_codon:yes gene_type:complete